ncbi:hypothetical protein D3C73_928950 [compost metagenome]
MVPDGFQAIFRDRERRGGTIQVIHAKTVELDVHRFLLDLVGDRRRHHGGPMGRIDRHRIVRVLGQQRLHARRDLVLVLRHVGRGNGEQRFLVGERINIALVRAPAGRRLRHAPGVRGDGAIGVAGHLATQRRQVLAQAGGLVGSDLGVRRTAQGEQQGRRHAAQARGMKKVVHRTYLLLFCQKL